MFQVEYCRLCKVCETVTPHSQRRFAVLRPFSILLISGSIFLLGIGVGSEGAATLFVPALGLLVGMVVHQLDRERFWRVHCERCRGKKRREVLATKPTLDGMTEIGF